MTGGPPVTVVDPVHPAAPVPAPRAAWTRAERGLALVCLAVLVVGLAAARNLRAQHRDSPMVADAGRLTFVLDSPAYLRLELVVAGPHEELAPVRRIRGDSGWVLHGTTPDRITPGVLLTLAHPVDCRRRAALPAHLHVRTGDGKDVSLRVLPLDVVPLSSCDPVTGPDAVVALPLSSTATRARLPLANISTQPHTLTRLSFPAFDLGASVPLTLPGRDRSRSLSLDDVDTQDLQLEARVPACGPARRQLDSAFDLGDPVAVPAEVDGTPTTLFVTGLTAYLDLVWRGTCVR